MAIIAEPPYFATVVNAGEKRLLDYLKAKLPDTYTLVPNVEIASTNPRNQRTQYWEYDLLVVAPHAIYNLENKDWKGRIEGDDNYWYLNDRQRPNPLKTGRQKTAVLASKLKEHDRGWGRAWVQNMVTLSYPNTYAPSLWQEAGKLTFALDAKLVTYLTDPHQVGKSENDIASIQHDIVEFLVGNQSKKQPNEKREVVGREIIEVLQQEPHFTEYLTKPKGVTSSVKHRVKEYSLQVSGLSAEALKTREEAIKNQYQALHKLKAKPFILNVEFKIDEENHLFYEISDFLDENSLRAEARHKTFTFGERIDIIRNIMAALKEAHKVNVFHRDINPDNIFLSSGYAYLGHFSKSYFADHQKQGYTVMATVNEANATPFHPLEMTVGEASRASDIYSLGVLIYWLFTEQEPVKSPYELDRLGGRLPDDRLPTALNPALPEWLDTLCHRTILVDDTQRFDTIEELEDFINASLEESITTATPAKPSEATKGLDELVEGDRVGEYTIYETLGRGGYSRVFRVKHSLQGKEYALKLFNESVNVTSVIDEYTALKDLRHPNIVQFVWNGHLPNGQFYTLTEYLNGENLSAYTRTETRLPLYRVYEVARDILAALVEMQAQQPKPILHRDVKPQNIMWDSKERFVLIDFNVASFAEENQDFVGTNPYLAPDLIADNYQVNWNISADTFALGITLYELVTKQYPWAPGRLPLTSKPPTAPQTIEPRISDTFAAFLTKAIGTSSTTRFANAQEMLDALEAIGPDRLLAEKTLPPTDQATSEEAQDFVAYVNSLYSQSKHGNTGTRANFTTSDYDQRTYTPTKLDKHLIPAVLDGQFKLLIITGNAGDGKTAFVRKIEEEPGITDLQRFEHKNGARFQINGVPYESNYDGSQDEENNANHEVLEKFFRPFRDGTDFQKATEGRIIAINEGRLVEFLSTSSQYQSLYKVIDQFFNQEGHSTLPNGLMLINLNLRSVVAEDNDEPSLFRKQIRALSQKEHWKQCEGCSLANQCFIKYNVDTFNDTATGESVISRAEWLLRTASLKRELHVTMRDLRSFIAFLLTRDYRCEDVEALWNDQESAPETYWQHYYFNITNPTVDDSGHQDRLIKLLRETDVGEVVIPDLDRDLFFGQHEPKDYLEFSEREISLLDTFNHHKIRVPAHEQSAELIARVKTIQKVFVRHQYFEGRAKLVTVLTGAGSQEADNQMPSFLQRLPYHSIFKFVQVLQEGDTRNETKISVSRTISLNEGCDNAGLDSTFLVLSSTEVDDPISKSFRLFSLNDFELVASETDHLVKFLEYEPDSLTFRHQEEKHIRLTISLDLYEMLYFIQQGYSPSLNDLKGKFIELIIFKNLLKNLDYQQVVVTQDNRTFYRISADEQNHLRIELVNL